jgi:hypothetical protein
LAISTSCCGKIYQQLWQLLPAALATDESYCWNIYKLLWQQLSASVATDVSSSGNGCQPVARDALALPIQLLKQLLSTKVAPAAS